MKMNRKSVILARNEIIDMLIPKVVQQIQAWIPLLVTKGEMLAEMNDLGDISHWQSHVLQNKWCELCSEDFFKGYPEIDDVLYQDVGVEKVWLCSRDDWEEGQRKTPNLSLNL